MSKNRLVVLAASDEIRSVANLANMQAKFCSSNSRDVIAHRYIVDITSGKDWRRMYAQSV